MEVARSSISPINTPRIQQNMDNEAENSSKNLKNINQLADELKNQETEKVEKEDPQNSEEEKKTLKEQVDNLNDFLKPQFTSLKFEYHEKAERYMVKVVEQGTDKVIREIPPKEFLDMITKMMDFVGLMVDKKI